MWPRLPGRAGHHPAPQVLAAPRNAATTLLRRVGSTNSAVLLREQRRRVTATPPPDVLEAHRERERSLADRYFEKLSPERKAVLFAKWHASGRRDYEITLTVADQRGARWTEDDDRYILANPEQPARELALALGRTSWAVYRRRRKLRRQVEDTGPPHPDRQPAPRNPGAPRARGPGRGRAASPRHGPDGGAHLAGRGADRPAVRPHLSGSAAPSGCGKSARSRAGADLRAAGGSRSTAGPPGLLTEVSAGLHPRCRPAD